MRAAICNKSIATFKHARGREEAYTGVWWGNLRERDHLEEAGADGRIILS
jgi:hypothetical protein